MKSRIITSNALALTARTLACELLSLRPCRCVLILPRIVRKRLLALAAQKFVSDIAADAYQHARIRTNAAGGRARANQGPGTSRVGVTFPLLMMSCPSTHLPYPTLPWATFPFPSLIRYFLPYRIKPEPPSRWRTLVPRYRSMVSIPASRSSICS